MGIVFSWLKNKFSKDIGECSIFPKFLFQLLNGLFLILKQIILSLVTKGYFRLDTGYQNQQYNNTQDHDINFFAQIGYESSYNGH